MENDQINEETLWFWVGSIRKNISDLHWSLMLNDHKAALQECDKLLEDATKLKAYLEARECT